MGIRSSRGWAFWLAAALAASATTVAIACSSSDGGDKSPTPTTPASTVAAPTEAPAAVASPPASATAQPANGSAAGVEIKVASGELGDYLVGPNGHTLYVFLKDTPDTSNCTAGCLQNWPQLLLEAGETVEADSSATGTFASIDTPTGTQVTYNGAPLYYFAADAAPGDTKGDGVGKVWFVARPDTGSTAIVGVHSSGDDTYGDVAYLVGPTGMTLYVFAKDSDGLSNCSGGCLDNWPALTVPEGVDPSAVPAAGGTLSTLTRDSGDRQVTYNGQPLYYFAGDKKPGDTSGDGVGGVWEVATP